VRTSTEDRTMQVAGAMLAAMDPFVAGLPWPVYTQPASVRSRSRRRPRWTHTTTNHTSPPRLTLSSRHIRAPPQPLCARLSRPCQRGRTTSKGTRLSRRALTPSLAQLDSTPGPVGVCGFLSGPWSRCQFNPSLRFSSHEIIRRPLFRRVDRTYLSWPSAPL